MSGAPRPDHAAHSLHARTQQVGWELNLVSFEEMKNNTNCFMSLLGQSSVTTNFEKSLHKIKSQKVLE